MAAVLVLGAGAVVAGNSSFTAIAGWVADVPAELLALAYARGERRDGLAQSPSKSTIWCLVRETDPSQG